MLDFRKVDFMGNINNEEIDEPKKQSVSKNSNVEVKGRTFFKIYDDNFAEIISKLKGKEFNLMLLICSMMTWDNRIFISKLVKKKFMAQLSLTNDGTVRNIIASLCKKGFLKRLEPRVYLVNDAYFSKQAEPHIKAKRKAGRFNEQISPANDDII